MLEIKNQNLLKKRYYRFIIFFLSLHIIFQVIYVLVSYTAKELDLVARLMRAEALGEGNLGMLMVGNVIVNRAIANCDIFKN